MSDNLSGAKTRKLFGENLRKIRKSEGLTQVEFASRLNVGQGELSALENGTKGFSSDSLERLALSVGLEPWELLRPGIVADGIDDKKNEREQQAKYPTKAPTDRSKQPNKKLPKEIKNKNHKPDQGMHDTGSADGISLLSKDVTSGPLLAADGAVILARLEEVSDEQRKFLLALLFEDASLAKGVKIPDLSAFLRSFQKAE